MRVNSRLLVSLGFVTAGLAAGHLGTACGPTETGLHVVMTADAESATIDTLEVRVSQPGEVEPLAREVFAGADAIEWPVTVNFISAGELAPETPVEVTAFGSRGGAVVAHASAEARFGGGSGQTVALDLTALATGGDGGFGEDGGEDGGFPDASDAGAEDGGEDFDAGMDGGSDAGWGPPCTKHPDCPKTEFCNPSGFCQPQLANGQPCDGDRYCENGQCDDGVCCNSDCDGDCESCTLAGTVGTCTPVPAGSPGVPSCAPYLCSGTTRSCPSSCASAAGCVAQHGCSLEADGGTACLPRVHLLRDDFDDGLANTAKWWTWMDPGSTVSETGGGARVVTPAFLDGGSSSAGWVSRNVYDARESHLQIAVADPGDLSLTGIDVRLVLSIDEDQVRLSVRDGQLHAQQNVNDVFLTHQSVPYSPAAMRYLRLRETSGQLYWEFSSDGVTFFPMAQVASPTFLQRVEARFSVGTYEPQPSTTVVFDDVNLLPDGGPATP